MLLKKQLVLFSYEINYNIDGLIANYACMINGKLIVSFEAVFSQIPAVGSALPSCFSVVTEMLSY